MFTAAILAGGRARRLGGIDKGGLRVGAATIVEGQLARLRPLTPHILVVTSDMTRPPEADVTVVADEIPGAGSLGGLYTALVHAPVDPVLVIACDMPFLTGPFLTYMVDMLGGADAVVPRTARGRHPLCAVYARRVAPRLRARLDAGQLRVLDAIADLDVREIGPAALHAFDPGDRLLVNVNTPDDYRDACARATGASD